MEVLRLANLVAAVLDRAALKIASGQGCVVGHRDLEGGCELLPRTQHLARLRVCFDSPIADTAQRDPFESNRQAAGINHSHPHLKPLAGDDRPHGGRRREGGARSLGTERRGNGSKLKPQGRIDRVLELPLFDRQQEKSLVAPFRKADRLASQAQSLRQKGRDRRRVVDAVGCHGVLDPPLDRGKQSGNAVGRRAAQKLVDARDRGVDSVEESGFSLLGRDAALQPLEELVVGAGSLAPPAADLGALKAQAQGRELLVALSQPRAEGSGVDVDVPAVIGRLGARTGQPSGPEIAAVEFERLPRPQPLLADLLRESIRVPGSGECLLGRDSRDLVIAVAVSRSAVEAGDEHQGAIDANDPHDVPQDVFSAPLPERFVQVLRVAVVDQRGEVLIVQAVIPIGNQHLLRPDQAQTVEQFRPDGVGPALPPVQGEQRSAHAPAAAQVGQCPPLLVVRMGRGVQDARCRLEPQKALP